jgi:hypothetical protein
MQKLFQRLAIFKNMTQSLQICVKPELQHYVVTVLLQPHDMISRHERLTG